MRRSCGRPWPPPADWCQDQRGSHVTYAPADEAALLDQARAGDQAAFGGLVTRYEAGVRLHCYRMLGSFQDAEDVTRAVLLLRDVLGFSAAETAQLLEMTVAGANSALQRARATLEPHRASGRLPGTPRPAGDQTGRLLLGRYVAAWHASNVPALLSLL